MEVAESLVDSIHWLGLDPAAAGGRPGPRSDDLVHYMLALYSPPPVRATASPGQDPVTPSTAPLGARLDAPQADPLPAHPAKGGGGGLPGGGGSHVALRCRVVMVQSLGHFPARPLLRPAALAFLPLSPAFSCASLTGACGCVRETEACVCERESD